MPRRSPQQSITLTAAAKRINMGDPTSAKRDAAKTKPWHAEAWGYFDEVPEIKESIRYRGNQLGKVRLFVAVQNPKDPSADPIPASDPDSGVPANIAAAADAELARLRSRMGGQAEIMRMLDMNLEVVGEAYLVGYGERAEVVDPVSGLTTQEGAAEDWMIRSVSEVEFKGSGQSAKVMVKADPTDTKGTPLDPEQDTIMRIWLRHPQWANVADCSMRGLLGECRQLQVLCQQQLAHSYRALSAGILTVPNEVANVGPADPTKPEEPVDDPLMDILYEVLSAPIEDPTHPSTVQPGLLRGPGQYLGSEFVRRITFYDAEQVKDIEARIEARVQRIARGLNLPIEKIMGHMQTTFTNAAQIDEDEFSDYLAPSAETAAEALTFAYLRPQLEEAKVAPEWVERLFIWYDPSDLIAKPDAEKHAADAFDRNVISAASLRKAFGFGDDDAPEPLELLQRAGLRRGILTADLTHALLELLGIPIEVPQGGAAQPVDPNAEATAAMLVQALSASVPRTIRAASRPVGNDYGRRLTELDRELRTRLLSAANVAMGQALDRAANRLRTKTNGSPLRASLQTVPRRSWFAHLGPTLVAEAMGDEDPLEGAWDGLEDDFMAWGADAQAQARSVAAQATGRDQSDLADRQADDLSNAWLWLAGALTALAVAKLWTPDPAAPEIGEHDPSVMIPAGLVRQAIARAGGATGLSTSGTDAWVTLTDGGTRPAGGIGTGETIRGALRDGGAQVEGYVWRYGPGFRRNPFDPHLALDGQSFVSFDDDVLASDGTFGFSHWMPGDHAGDLCDAEPVILGREDLS